VQAATIKPEPTTGDYCLLLSAEEHSESGVTEKCLWLLIVPWKVVLQCQCSWQLLHGHVMKSN